jgi:ABC-type sugar transport system ATPase subunit/ribose/xylose/arabinose/galactoside ABC-type transport system permease subunit
MSQPVLNLREIDKHFGGVPALRRASLEVAGGEIHGLVGENGAGKSTLINIATGVLTPDSGELLLDGTRLRLSSPREAAKAGLAVVHQEAELFPELSVAENMLLHRGLVRAVGGWIDWPGTYREAEQLVAALGESFDVRQPAARLSVARRMLAEISAAVSERPRVLFLDEPTASLTQKEIRYLFEQIHSLRQTGVGIVYVSHRLDEVLEVCDRVTILRDGQTIETVPISGLTLDRMVSAMVGREGPERLEKQAASPGAIRLQVSNATDAEGAFQNVSMEVRSGEIVGMYGFVGAGRSELGQALFGLRRLAAGTVKLDGRALSIRSPRQAVEAGLAYLPEDRLAQGIFRSHSLRTNTSVVILRQLSRFGCVRREVEKALTKQLIQSLNVRAASIDQPVGTLSGGNQQKVMFGRWQAASPKVLILDEPTRGVDVAAKAEIHKLIKDLAAGAIAVVVISSELPEIMTICDRVVTLSEGRQTGIFTPHIDSQETIAAAAVPRTGTKLTTPDSATQSAETGAVPSELLPDEVSVTQHEPKTQSFALHQQYHSRFSRVLRLREAGLVGFIFALSLMMTFLKPAEFATPRNFYDILASAALPAIMAQGAMLVICAGGIDISVGSMMGLVAAITALASNAGYPAWLCLAMATGLGTAFGAINGTVAFLSRIHPILVTLAGISVYRGLMHLVTGGREVGQLPAGYRALADGNWFDVPKVCFYVIAVTLLVHGFLRYTLAGRQLLALGNSESAARLIGLSKAKLMLMVFAVSGTLTGFTSLLHGAYYGTVQANTGEGMELKAIAAAVIGGTNIRGGRGSALGTLPGAFLVALLYNILVLLEASAYWQNIFLGGLILLAVVADAGLERWR